MSLAAASLWTAVLWLVIHAVKYTARRQRVLLPLAKNRRQTTEVVVKHLHVRLKTEAFNVFHDKLSVWLSPSNSPILRQVLLTLYNIGSVVGVIGMLLAFLLLFLTVASLFSEILHAGRDHHSASLVTKRGLDNVPDSTPLASGLLRINPVVPGLTAPLSHLPLILVALSISQIVHEFGHAIPAALHRIPMLSCGIAATFFVPSAFVTLPAARLEKLLPRERLQIVSGGCFHNFALVCLLFSAAWSRACSFPTWILFQDISTEGRSVVSVDHDSPLAAHLPVGSLITMIDDFSMVSVSLDNPWDRFLRSPSLGSTKGWCTDDHLLNKTTTSGCSDVDGSRSCFVSKADETIQYELDPVHIFTDSLPRCNYPVDCSSDSSCVIPRGDQQLVRISILRNHAGTNIKDMVVWKGPKEEIWEQVQVSNLRPRFNLISSKLPELTSTFFEYMKIANLSLYLFNLLPITALDGHQSLAALLQLFYGRVSNDLESIDLEALDNATRLNREGRGQRAFRTFLNFLALFLVALCCLLGILCWATK